jgi:hypothetical protein
MPVPVVSGTVGNQFQGFQCISGIKLNQFRGPTNDSVAVSVESDRDQFETELIRCPNQMTHISIMQSNLIARLWLTYFLLFEFELHLPILLQLKNSVTEFLDVANRIADNHFALNVNRHGLTNCQMERHLSRCIT